MSFMKNLSVKKLSKFIYWVFLSVLIFVAVIILLSTLNLPNSYKLMVVQSGSMEPAIKTGSVVMVRPEPTYKIGDVITFRNIKDPKITTTHRVYEINGGLFTTKGDANDATDSTQVTQNQIIGKTVFTLPYLGYPVNFAKTQKGLIILVIIPAVIIIYSELINIKNEAVRLVKERRTGKLNAKEEIEEKIGKEIIAVEKKLKKKNK